jgi:hypothetical protein
MAVGVNGTMWVWGEGSSYQLGLGDTNERLVQTLVGAEEDEEEDEEEEEEDEEDEDEELEELFGGSNVLEVAC